MLLESIKLVNFRQFQDETIDFASGNDGKNVTIIIGENGTGKTTLAQAFFWCMYGETGFKIKSLLNTPAAMALKPGQETKVLVELKLKHGEVSYTLTREQSYKKESQNKISPDNSIFDVAKKKASGETEYISSRDKSLICEAEVKKILPKELARYFFFDGERIENMGKAISSDNKSVEFEEAVKGLLGLYPMLSAIARLNPRKRDSVIGSYENSYDPKSNAKIEEYTNKIKHYDEEIEKYDARLTELENDIASAEGQKKDKEEELKQYEESKELQEKRESLYESIERIKNTKAFVFKNICQDFNKQLDYFFSTNMMKRALEFLAERDFIGKDIPYMHAKTVEYLLSQGKCICGTCLQEGSIPYQKVKELINFLPPQSLSATVGDFKNEAKSRADVNGKLQDIIKENLAVIRKQNNDIATKQKEISAIDAKLSGADVQTKVRAIEQEIKVCEQIISGGINERAEINANRKIAVKGRTTADTQRRELALLDKKNRNIEIYKAYAERIYEDLNRQYLQSEEAVRNKLQETINDIFNTIYNGGLSLSINPKYHITVNVNELEYEEYDGEVETSTAQSISVIFAFIASIIKIARENQEADDEDMKLLDSEPYPLVMDAPLSTFDKKRIKTICATLPEIAEQVIIFIKDTDGDYAREHIANKLGRLYTLEKKNEFKTVINRGVK